jgi:hypothetical protein
LPSVSWQHGGNPNIGRSNNESMSAHSISMRLLGMEFVVDCVCLLESVILLLSSGEVRLCDFSGFGNKELWQEICYFLARITPSATRVSSRARGGAVLEDP